MRKFKKQINNLFDVSNLKNTEYPIFCFNESIDFLDFRVNHFCIKNNDSEKIVFNGLPKELVIFLKKILIFCKERKLNFKDRYIYVTVDNKQVSKNKTQRDPGWHIDGMQGGEVLVKKKADFQFVYCSSLPTLFTSQGFNLNGFNEKKNNLFHKLENQIDNSKIKEIDCNAVYLMNPYHVHSAQKCRKEHQDRLFIRVSFSCVPVTSVKMTINPSFQYNYTIHTSSGEIPNYLK